MFGNICRLRDVSTMQNTYLSTALFFQLYYMTTFQITATSCGSKHPQKEMSRDYQNNLLCELTEAMTVTFLTSSKNEVSLICNAVLLALDHVRQNYLSTCFRKLKCKACPNLISVGVQRLLKCFFPPESECLT